MTLPRKTPREGGRTIHWTYRGTDRGEEWFGYLWGEVHGYLCHTRGRSKPCLHEMTGGELSCEGCTLGIGVQWLGYVPIVRESDGRPVFVIVHATAAQLVESLKWRTRVLISRGAEADDGTAVVRAPAQRQWQTTLAGLMAPADLTRTLLTVWKMPALTAWYEATHGKAVATMVPPSSVPPVAADVLADDQGDDAITRELREAMRRHPPRGSKMPGLIGDHLNGRHHEGKGE